MSKKYDVRPVGREDGIVFGALEASREFYSLTDANDYFAVLSEHVPEVIKTANNLYQYKDYFFNIGKRFAMAGHAQVLMNIAEWEISCAPEGIGYVWFENDHDMMLVTRIKASAGHGIVPLEQLRLKVSDLSQNARSRILADADRLMEKGYACAAITENHKAWHIIEDEDRVIISHWVLAEVSEKAKTAYRRRLLDMLRIE